MSEQGWITIITVVCAAIPPTILAYAALLKLRKVQKNLNSRLTQLLTLAGERGEAKGRADERAEARVRASDAEAKMETKPETKP